MNNIKDLVDIVKKDGIVKTHIKDILDQKGIDLFNQVIEFYEGYINNPEIGERMNRIASGNPIRDRNKPYEIVHYNYLKRPLNLDDALIKLYMQDVFIDAAEHFYGELPRMRNVVAWLHPQNPQTRETNSQVWHRDQEDFKIFKVFLNISDIKSNNGPTQYVKETQDGAKYGDITNNMNNQSTSVFKYPLPTENIVDIQGEPGTVHFINTNGVHKGGLVREGLRCLTQANFLHPKAPAITRNILGTFDCYKEGNYADVNSDTYKNLSDRQKYLLG